MNNTYDLYLDSFIFLKRKLAGKNRKKEGEVMAVLEMSERYEENKVPVKILKKIPCKIGERQTEVWFKNIYLGI